VVTTSTADVLARAFADLESAYALACRAARDDLLSPWGNTAMSIHLAAAGLSRYLPEPVQTAEHADCLTALHAAQQELLSLDVEHGLSLVDFTLVRSRVGSALAEAESLPR
jgi:hypothetical protein